HVLLGLGREYEHEVELYFCPSALKSLSRSVEDIFFCQPFVDHLAHPLGSCLRSKCKTALPDILHSAHDIQRKCIDPQRRERDVDSLTPELVDQEKDQLLQLRIVA